MIHPERVAIFIDATGYKITCYGNDTKELWHQQFKMVSAGRSQHASGEEVFDCAALQDFEDLQKEIDDLSFGPFGVASALYKIKEDL